MNLRRIRNRDNAIIKEIPGLYVIDRVGNHTYVESYKSETYRPFTGCVMYDYRIYPASDIRKYITVDHTGLIHDTLYLPTSIGRPLLDGNNVRAIARVGATSLVPIMFATDLYYTVSNGKVNIEKIEVGNSSSQPSKEAKPLNDVKTHVQTYGEFNAIIYDIPEVLYVHSKTSIRDILHYDKDVIREFTVKLDSTYLDMAIPELSYSDTYNILLRLRNVRVIVQRIIEAVPHGHEAWSCICNELNIAL